MTERNYFVHESAYVDDPVEIGSGTKIWHFSHVQSGARLGERCNPGPERKYCQRRGDWQ
jgi:UDP-2-acetamido-3-amino-2,3-dideoxy-glucuronate N-acetyltransferase